MSTNFQDPALQQAWAKIQQLHPEANFLQSPEWGETNQLIGHQVIIEQNLATTPNPDPPFWCLMIVKNAKRGRYLEIPGGPLLDWHNLELVSHVFQLVRATAQREKCVFVRLRPQLEKSDQNLQLLQAQGLAPAPMHLHAEHTVILDLTQSEEEILKNMRRQTRYEVRRAEKQGITVEWSNSEAIFREFAGVQAATAARQHFIPPDFKTLLAERQAFGDQARLYVAYAPAQNPATQNSEPVNPETQNSDSQKRPIAYGLILISGSEAEYFEAASTDLNRKLPGAYALQWQVIKDLKALKIKRYNLWGIAPPDSPNHRYAGVTTFKTGFGGTTVEFVPAHDLIISRLRYQVNLIIETIRKKRRKL